MRRNCRRVSSRSVDRFQLGMEKLEPRVLLACDMQLLNDGILQITGDNTAQTVSIVDRGDGNVDVQCQEPGIPLVSRGFSGVAGIRGNLKGGKDVLNYFSDQDVNAAMASLEFLMGSGNDRANVEVTLRGTPTQARGFGFVTMGDGGHDTLRTTINSLTSSPDPTQPVVQGEMHGGGGRDEMTLVSNTSAGGFILSKTEQAPSASGGTTDPDCLIWDLIDGSSGEVNAQVMGSNADELIELRTDARGVGRSKFDFVLDGGGGVNALNSFVTFTGQNQGEIGGAVRMSNGMATRLQVNGIVDLVAATTSAGDGTTQHFFTIEIAEGRLSSVATLDIIGSERNDAVQINVGAGPLTDLAIEVDGRGGNDAVSYTMFQAEGTPVRATMVELHGGDGDDVLRTVVNTPVDSGDPNWPVAVGEMHGGNGRDEMTLVSNTSAGGFILTNNELNPSAGETTTSRPGCLIWDLVDGTTGQVDAHVVSSNAASLVTLQTDPRGVGRSNFDFVIEGGREVVSQPIVIGSFWNHGDQEGNLTILNANETRLDIHGVVELSAISRSANDTPIAASRFGISVDGVQIAAFLEFVGSAGRDDVAVGVSANRLDDLQIDVATGGGNDNVASFVGNGSNQGIFQQTIDTGAGSDTVIQSIQGFQVFGTATFDTQLGAGADTYLAVADDIQVAEGANLSIQVDGGNGHDLILAAVQATVDGNYHFVARGGRGNDTMAVAQAIDTNWRPGNGNPNDQPSIDIRLEGNEGNDLIGLWIAISEENEDFLDALVDGGLGDDTAFTSGPIQVINVEHPN